MLSPTPFGEAVERRSEAGEPTGAREHVCGPSVILTASVKGAREISARRSPLAKQVARAVRARQNHAGGVPANCGSGEQVGRRPRLRPPPSVLVAEAALAGEDHRDACVVRTVNHVPIADCSTGLHDRRDSLADADFESVAEREERVRNHRATREPALLGLRLLHDLRLLLRAVVLAELEAEVIERKLVLLPRDPVGVLRVRLVARDLRDADAILLGERSWR